MPSITALSVAVSSVALLSLAARATLAQALPAPEPRFALTVYSSASPSDFDPRNLDDNAPFGRPQLPGFGVVREIRPIDLAAGANAVRFTDVASGIDPTTVTFESLTDPAGTAVLEQNYEYDLVSTAKLLQKYVDQQVTVERELGGRVEQITGTLLSAADGLILRTDTGVRVINGHSGISVSDAAGLITKPTLVWNLTAARAGKHDARVTYQTDGLTWRADYTVVLNEANTAADVGAWVTLVNKSGAAYPDTKLKLVAGDVQRFTPPQNTRTRRDMVMMAAKSSIADSGFAEKSLLEYHLYTLGRTTSLPNNSTKQIELFEKKLDVPVKKTFVYYGLAESFRTFMSPNPATDRELGTEMNKKVDVYLTIDNKEAAGLGLPLPAGRVRVMQRDDAEKTQEFVGEDVIGHTAKDETVRLRLGSAFDVVGGRVQTAFTLGEKTATESFKITLRNHKKEAVRVTVKENLYRWVNWQITDKSDAFTQPDSRTAHFDVDVPADGEKVVTYTVKYAW